MERRAVNERVTTGKKRPVMEQLSQRERVSACSGRDFWNTEPLKGLGLPSVMMADGPHGLRKQVDEGDHLGMMESLPATCFPTAVGLASTWDIPLLNEIGAALARECHRQGVSLLLGPGLNIKRHPLCGRNFEYFSEDPYLSGVLAAALVDGLQDNGIGACIKHFAVNNQEYHRLITDAVVDPRTLREIYLAGFAHVVKHSQPWSIMAAYNKLNGVFCCEHQQLLTEILRDEWGFEGFVVSDWGAVNDRIAGIKAGMDLEMPGNKGQFDDQIQIGRAHV